MSEGDCTRETGSGQFSIFGAVEEKMWRRIFPGDRAEATSASQVARALNGAVLARWIWRGGNQVSGAEGMSTGRAQEMQKGRRAGVRG